jgi:hypothetical protein
VAQEVECPPSKHQVLSLNPSTAKKQKRKQKWKKEGRKEK